MSITVLNPATGRYVTSGVTTPASPPTPALKTQSGTQVTLGQATSSSVKVSISTQGQAAAFGGVPTSMDTLRAKLDSYVKISDPTKSLSFQAYSQLSATDQAAYQIVDFDPATLPPTTLTISASLSELVTPPMSATGQSRLQALAASGAGHKLMSVRTATGATASIDAAAAAGLSANILNLFAGNLSLNLSSDLSSLDSQTSAKLKALGQANKITTLTVEGASPNVTLKAADVAALGPNLWARYGGDVTVTDTTANIAEPTAWESIRVLNNYRNLPVNMITGLADGSGLNTDPPQKDMTLSYDQLVSGYSLLKNITTQPRQVSFGPATRDPVSPTALNQKQSLLVYGQLQNRDEFKLSLVAPGQTTPTQLTIGPLDIQPGDTAVDRVRALRNAIAAAISISPAFAGQNAPTIGVKATGNQLQFTYAGAAPGAADLVSLTQTVRGADSGMANTIDVTGVPPDAVKTLKQYPEVSSVSLLCSSDQMNYFSSSLNPLAAGGFIKKVNLTNIGTVRLTAAQAGNCVPLLEKLNGSQIVISDAPAAASSYARLTPAAMSKLAVSADIKGTFNDIMKSLDSLGALAATGKLHSLAITDKKGGQIELSATQAEKLSAFIRKYFPASFTIKIRVP